MFVRKDEELAALGEIGVHLVGIRGAALPNDEGFVLPSGLARDVDCACRGNS